MAVCVSTAASASDISSPVRYRSAGDLAIAVMITSSSSSGIACRMIVGGGTLSIVWRAMMAIAVGPVNGIWPTSISYSMHPRL